MNAPLGIITEEQIRQFCQKWKLSEFSLFGSILRDDFNDQSDVDVLIAFAPGHIMTLETFMEMRAELQAMFGSREIDLVQRPLIRNPFHRERILTTRKVLYAA